MPEGLQLTQTQLFEFLKKQMDAIPVQEKEDTVDYWRTKLASLRGNARNTDPSELLTENASVLKMGKLYQLYPAILKLPNIPSRPFSAIYYLLGELANASEEPIAITSTTDAPIIGAKWCFLKTAVSSESMMFATAHKHNIPVDISAFGEQVTDLTDGYLFMQQPPLKDMYLGLRETLVDQVFPQVGLTIQT